MKDKDVRLVFNDLLKKFHGHVIWEDKPLVIKMRAEPATLEHLDEAVKRLEDQQASLYKMLVKLGEELGVELESDSGKYRWRKRLKPHEIRQQGINDLL